MSHQYQSVLWNKLKKHYDLLILLFIVSFLTVFIAFNLLIFPEITQETLLIRAFGILAIMLLHVILAIGPLSRINPKFLVLLYNRRHLGVSMFIIASIHGGLSIAQFHGYGNVYPLFSIFISNTQYDSLLQFPFQTLGVFGLTILMLMAVTSHDFWLKNLGPKFWKTLHMMVYVAYVALLLHVVLGALQDEKSFVMMSMVLIGFLTILMLHIVSSIKSIGISQTKKEWVQVGRINEIPNNRAKTVFIENKKIAVFNYDNKFSAVSNYCKHQGGPLGEGKIIEGCITCPWHGYQYFPHNGCSPPPFDEKIETFNLKIEDGFIYVDPEGKPEGTAIEPLTIKQTN